MATKVTMPQLGESVTEGTISKWMVKVGDHVNIYDPLCEVMTDKVNAEVPASFAGKVTELVAQEDETIAVGELICYIQEEGSTTDGSAGNASEPVGSTVDEEGQGNSEEQVESKDQSMKHRYSPAVLKLSQEHNIDLEHVKGSGKGGRITRKDLQTIIDSGDIPTAKGNNEPAADSAASHPAPPAAQSAELQSSIGDTEVPLSGVRKAIASKMVQSKHEVPHAWTMVEVDVTNLVSYRSKIKDQFKGKEGLNLTFMPFFIKAIVEALKEFPMVNSQWAGDKIIQKKEINVSIAVATEEALYVPVIKGADEKSILGLARSVDELARKTREGKLTQEDMQGGTFTINNTGSFGSVQSMPIINHPQAAILSVEAIVKRPVIKEGMIAIRDMVNLCLSLDHRILDGLTCGRFLQSVKQKLEEMNEETDLY